MSIADGTLIELGSRALLRFQRPLAAPVGRVWQALADPNDLARWHPSPFVAELTVGAPVRYTAEDLPDGAVTDVDPPKVLVYTWGEDTLRWDLLEIDGGCILMLTDTFSDRFKAARDAAGWHLCLDRLTELVENAPDPGFHKAGVMPSGWDELNAAYQVRFGIDPSEATPVPQSR